jgi:hypothetical protein
VEEGDDGTLELGTATSVDGSGGESLPDDGLADVRGNEERDTAAETVALLQQLIEKNDNQAGNDQLHDQEDTDTSAQVTGLAIEPSEHVDTSLTKGQDDGKKLLGSFVQFTVGLKVKVDIDQVSSGEKLIDRKSAG